MCVQSNAKSSSPFCAKLHEERQLAWDQREVELERQLDQYEKQQNETLNGAEKVNYRFHLLIMVLYKLHNNIWLNPNPLMILTILYCFQCADGTGSLPDPSLPLAHQLQFALAQIRKHVRTIHDTKATFKTLDEV